MTPLCFGYSSVKGGVAVEILGKIHLLFTKDEKSWWNWRKNITKTQGEWESEKAEMLKNRKVAENSTLTICASGTMVSSSSPSSSSDCIEVVLWYFPCARTLTVRQRLFDVDCVGEKLQEMGN